MHGEDLRLLPRPLRDERDDRVRRLEPLDDDPLKAADVGLCLSLGLVLLRRVVAIIPRRYLDLQAAQPHLSNPPRLLHEVLQRAANFELVDRDERRNVRAALVANHHPPAADRHARKDPSLERLDGHFALELIAQKRNHLGFEGVRSYRNRRQRHPDDDGDDDRQRSRRAPGSWRVSSCFCTHAALRRTLKQGASHLQG